VITLTPVGFDQSYNGFEVSWIVEFSVIVHLSSDKDNYLVSMLDLQLDQYKPHSFFLNLILAKSSVYLLEKRDFMLSLKNVCSINLITIYM
jgi:hypothetical protein